MIGEGKGRGGACASAKRPGSDGPHGFGLADAAVARRHGRMISRLWKILRCVAVCGVLSGVASSRLAADLAADLAQISVENTGGAKAHASLKSFRATGVTKVGDKKIEFILYAARPRSVRIETVGEKGSLVRAFDGVLAPWKKDDPAQPPRRLGRAEEKDFILDADFDSPLYDYTARKISLDHAGTVVIDGKTHHKLLATLRFTDLVTLYLDAETMLLVRRDVRKSVRGQAAVFETHYGDFTKVNGVLLPRRIRSQVEGRVLHETVIEEYWANPPLSADFFAPPSKNWPKF